MGPQFWREKGGFYAEYACVPGVCVAHAPPRLHDDVLGGAPTVAVTAWTGIRGVLEVESTDVVIVHGASGAVGICALQFAALTKARVIAVASHDRDLLRELGAADVFDDRDANGRAAFAEAARGATKLLLLAPWPTELAADLKNLQIAYPNGVDAPEGVDATAFDGVPDRELWEQFEPQIEAHHFKLPIAATSRSTASQTHTKRWRSTTSRGGSPCESESRNGHLANRLYEARRTTSNVLPHLILSGDKRLLDCRSTIVSVRCSRRRAARSAAA